MTEELQLDQVEFVRLAGYPVRVTSLKRAGDAGDLHLVTITRGTRDPELLRDLLAPGVVDLEIPGAEARVVTVAGADIRHSGEGATMVSRFGITLRPAGDATPIAADEPTLEERVAMLEREVAGLRATIDRLASSQ